LSVALVMLLQGGSSFFLLNSSANPSFPDTGYGMTESCGMCAIMPPEVFRYDTVGLPVPSIEIKVCLRFFLLRICFLCPLLPSLPHSPFSPISRHLVSLSPFPLFTSSLTHPLIFSPSIHLITIFTSPL
jgi:hypothetical protein